MTTSLDLRGLVVLRCNGDLNVLLIKVHLSGESAVGLPLAGCAGSSLLKHLVNLLEGKALGLRNEEVGEKDCVIVSSEDKSVGFKERNLQEMQQRPPHMKKTLEPSLAEWGRSATR